MTLRGSVYAAKSDILAVLRDANAAFKINPDNPQTIALLTALYSAQKQNDKAIKLLEDSIARKPDNTSLRILLTNIYVGNNQAEKAIAQLKEVIA